MAVGSPRILPLPAGVRDAVEHALYDVGPDENLRYKIRRLAELVYGHGFDDGHFAGSREHHADREAVRVHRIEHPEELRAQVQAYLADHAPIWTQAVGETPEAAVLSLSDAATVAAKYITVERI